MDVIASCYGPVGAGYSQQSGKKYKLQKINFVKNRDKILPILFKIATNSALFSNQESYDYKFIMIIHKINCTKLVVFFFARDLMFGNHIEYLATKSIRRAKVKIRLNWIESRPRANWIRYDRRLLYISLISNSSAW